MNKKYRTKECDQFISHDLVWTRDEIMNFFEEVPEVAEIEPLGYGGKKWNSECEARMAEKIDELVAGYNQLLKEKVE